MGRLNNTWAAFSVLVACCHCLFDNHANNFALANIVPPPPSDTAIIKHDNNSDDSDSGSDSDSEWRIPHSKVFSSNQQLTPEQTLGFLQELAHLYEGTQDPAVILRQSKISKLISVQESTSCDLELFQQDYKLFEQSYEIYPNIVSYLGAHLSRRLTSCIFASTDQQTFEPTETIELLKFLQNIFIIWNLADNHPQLREINELCLLNSKKPKGCELTDLNQIQQLIALRSDQANIVAYLKHCLKNITKFCLFSPLICNNTTFRANTVYKYLLAYKECRNDDDSGAVDEEQENVDKLIELSEITDESCKGSDYASAVSDLLFYYYQNERIINYIKHRRAIQLSFCQREQLELELENHGSDSPEGSGQLHSMERNQIHLGVDDRSDSSGSDTKQNQQDKLADNKATKPQKKSLKCGKFLPKCFRSPMVMD